jgi:glutamyl-Q tRNA(Asp) synthetase
MSASIFRFAPSPNGYLHLGHAFSALINFDMARATGGLLLLRIEDVDHTRCRAEYEAAIYEDLAWLGIVWRSRPSPKRVSDDYQRRWAAGGPGRSSELESRAAITAPSPPKAAGSRPRDPDGAPLYPGTAKSPRPRSASVGSRPVRPMRCG